MNAREYLEQVQALDWLCENKNEELYQLRCLATSCGGAMRQDGGSSGVGDRVGNLVSRICDLEESLVKTMAAYVEQKQDCIDTIERVRPSVYYTILHKHHVQYKSLVEIADEIGYEYHYVCELHRKALAEVQKILDEKDGKTN